MCKQFMNTYYYRYKNAEMHTKLLFILKKTIVKYGCSMASMASASASMASASFEGLCRRLQWSGLLSSWGLRSSSSSGPGPPPGAGPLAAGPPHPPAEFLVGQPDEFLVGWGQLLAGVSP